MNIFSDSNSEIKNTKGLLLIMFVYAISLSFIYATSEYYQPLMQMVNFPITFFGVIYLSKRFAVGLGAEFSHRIEKYFNTLSTIFIIGALILLSYFGTFFNFVSIVISAIILFSIAEGILRVTILDELNKRVSSKNRATIISTNNLIKQIFLVSLTLIYGYLADLIGIQTMLLAGAGLFTILFTTVFILIKSRKIFN